VPLLRATDPLPRQPQRVLVAGTSGAGKTTLARAVAGILGCPHVELDALYHGPGWTQRAEFVAEVDLFSAGPAWTTEYQYATVRHLLLERADLFVWLDLPRPVVMGRVIRRTVSRRLRRATLWNGNQEPPLWTFFTDREHIVRYAWQKHAPDRIRLGAVARDRPELPVVGLTSRADLATWLAGPLRTAATG
jgi:adenylate kinase family enzyme